MINISDCVFNQTGGNAVLLSNDVTDTTITHSEFVLIGDSAIATLGTTDLIFGTASTFPNRIHITNNHIHEVGVYGKQTSCYFQALAANVTLRNNLCYNGPRAGINWWVRARPLRVLSCVALRLRCGCGGSLGLSLC